MGSCKFLALILFLLVLALLPDDASPRVLQDEKPSSDEVAAAPTTVSEPQKSDLSKELGQSSFAVQNPGPKKHPESPTPANPAPAVDNPTNSAGPEKKDLHTSPPNSAPPPPNGTESKGQEASPVKVLPPPPNVTAGKSPMDPSDTGQGKGGKGAEETGGKGDKERAPDKIQEGVGETCDAGSEECRVGEELFACLQVSQNASNGLFVIVQNKGQNAISVDVKPTTNINVDVKQLKVSKGGSEKVKIIYSNPNGGNILLNAGKGDCILHIRQPISDWQQQFQQFAAYATRLNPMYGAYFFIFTVVLVGAVWACCKFARRRRGDAGVPYQQLEMGAQAPSSAVGDNTASTVDGWEDGWDDDWDDEEAAARPSDKNPAESVSANGLSSRSRNNSKDGWDVDWDD